MLTMSNKNAYEFIVPLNITYLHISTRILISGSLKYIPLHFERNAFLDIPSSISVPITIEIKFADTRDAISISFAFLLVSCYLHFI